MAGLDSFLFNVIHGFSGQVKILDWLAVFLAEYLGYFLIIWAIILIFKESSFQKRFYYFALTAVSLILSRGLIAETIRFFYYRPRPFEALNFIPLINQDTVAAFPSGHAAFYFALTFAIFYVSRRWFYWFLAGAVLMGLARVFIGVHWPLDILAGALIGLFSIFMVKYTLARTLKIKVSD